MTLAEALETFDLEPGRTYEFRVGDNWVQVKVVPSTELAVEQQPLTVDAMEKEPAMPVTQRLLRVHYGSVYDNLQPIVITEDDLAPGDLP